MSPVGLVFLGLAIGALGTLIGAGGGFMLAPILLLLYPHESPAVLTAISLTVVCANATTGSIAYARMKRIDYRAGLVFALAGLPGAVLGASLSQGLDHRRFDVILGIVLIVGAFVLLVGRSDEGGEVHWTFRRALLGAVLSALVAFVASLVGVGGGVLHVPLLVRVLDFPAHVATATSHFVLAILSLAAVLEHARAGTLAPALDRIVPLGIGVIAGAPLGARLSSRISGKWILRGLALGMAALGLRLVF